MVMLAMTRILMVTILFFAFLPLILHSYYSIVFGVSSLRRVFLSLSLVPNHVTFIMYCITRFVHFFPTHLIILGPQVLKLNAYTYVSIPKITKFG